MDELLKIKKVIDKELPDAKKEVLLVLDATTGQNAISQVKAFKEQADITGILQKFIEEVAVRCHQFATEQEVVASAEIADFSAGLSYNYCTGSNIPGMKP